MRKLTAEWLAKAEEDHSVATGLIRRRKIPANSICFHCQQAAEKYLKALLQEEGVRFGRTHDLEGLLRRLGDAAPHLLLLSNDLKLLSDYAVRYRYPGSDATAAQARRAVRASRRVRSAVRTILAPPRRYPAAALRDRIYELQGKDVSKDKRQRRGKGSPRY